MHDPARLLEEIRALEEKLHRPEVRSSKEATGALLADGFVEFGSSGTVWRREEMIEFLAKANNAADVAGLVACDYSLTTVATDAVLLTYRTSRLPENGGTARHVLRSSLWRYRDDRWQMIFHQGTLTAPPA